jgi:3,4-dihydroxy 2-butanone 4-phosphate synthase
MTSRVDEALRCLRQGKFVLVYDFDNRERETDMVIASEKATIGAIRTLRRDAGGLICTTASFDMSQKLGLPFLSDVLADDGERYPVIRELVPNDIPYDTKSAFSITINHRKTFTGITDIDRALTTSEFAKLWTAVKDINPAEARREFGRRFRSPGHVHLLNATQQLLSKRRGHTELTTALMTMSGMIPSATICEMMGDDGHALSKESARAYAEKQGLCYLEGQEIIDSWRISELNQ